MSMANTETLDPGAEFDAYFDAEIAPELEQIEGQRRILSALIVVLLVLAGAGLLLFFLADWLTGVTGLDKDLFGFGGFGLMGIGGIGAVLTYRYAKAPLKEVLVGRTCNYLGLDYSHKKFDFPVDRFREADVVGKHDSRKLEDRIAGTHNGVDLQLCEARLERTEYDDDRESNGNREKKTVTVFEGLLLMCSFEKPFTAHTLVMSDATWLGNKLVGLSKRGERVTLEDPRFERAYEVYSEDQVEARFLLNPTFMERLTELANRLGSARQLVMAFNGHDLMLALRSNENRFEGGSIFKSYLEGGRERADELFDELHLIHEVIDVLDLSSRNR